jgi:hypothetical protein
MGTPLLQQITLMDSDIPQKVRKRALSIDNWALACFTFLDWRAHVSIKLIFGNNPEEVPREGPISSQTLAEGLIHLHEDEPTTAELMAQLIYEDFVKNR